MGRSTLTGSSAVPRLSSYLPPYGRTFRIAISGNSLSLPAERSIPYPEKYNGGIVGIRKKSGVLASAALGIMFVPGALLLQIWNENRSVTQTHTLNEGMKLVAAISEETVEPANEGKLIHIQGQIDPKTDLSDTKLGLDVTALRLERTVSMYQWEEESEKRNGKTVYSYNRVWSEREINSSDFPSDKRNTTEMPFQSATIDGQGELGAFTVAEGMIQKFDWFQDLSMSDYDSESLPEIGGFAPQLESNSIYYGQDPSRPEIGDIRVSFRIVPGDIVSVIGKQQGEIVVPYTASTGYEIALAEKGKVTAAEMFQNAHDANTALTWILRVVGVIGLIIGINLVFAPLTGVADRIPVIGSLISGGVFLASLLIGVAVSSVTIALSWLAFRPMMSLGLLAVAGLCFWWTRKRGKKAAGHIPAASSTPPPAPTLGDDDDGIPDRPRQGPPPIPREGPPNTLVQ